jgi:hypothetical protein
MSVSIPYNASAMIRVPEELDMLPLEQRLSPLDQSLIFSRYDLLGKKRT